MRPTTGARSFIQVRQFTAHDLSGGSLWKLANALYSARDFVCGELASAERNDGIGVLRRTGLQHHVGLGNLAFQRIRDAAHRD
jgi:hypothetical protein